MGSGDERGQESAVGAYEAPALTDFGTIEDWTLGRMSDSAIKISVIVP